MVNSRNTHFGGGIKQMPKSEKIAPRRKIALGLLHHILGHRSTISLMSGGTSNVWKSIELMRYQDPFFT